MFSNIWSIWFPKVYGLWVEGAQEEIKEFLYQNPGPIRFQLYESKKFITTVKRQH